MTSAVCSQAGSEGVCVCVCVCVCPQALEAAAYLHHLMLEGSVLGPDGGQVPTLTKA